MSLSKADILGLDDKDVREIEVEGWSGTVFIRCWSGLEMAEVEKSAAGRSSASMPKDWKARIAALSLCDSKGERLFKDNEAQLLMDKSGKALNSIIEQAMKLNGLLDEEIREEAKN